MNTESDCRGASQWNETDLCSECLEHAEFNDSSNCCKQCKGPIEKGFRFCSGECKQYYYR
jgi:hypothetical protein